MAEREKGLGRWAAVVTGNIRYTEQSALGSRPDGIFADEVGGARVPPGLIHPASDSCVVYIERLGGSRYPRLSVTAFGLAAIGAVNMLRLYATSSEAVCETRTPGHRHGLRVGEVFDGFASAPAMEEFVEIATEWVKECGIDVVVMYEPRQAGGGA
jgi:hypothetical protein